MELIPVVIIVAVVFGLCFVVDKLFTKFFRGKEQHQSGKSVRFSKRYASIGIVLFALGVAGCFSGFGSNWLLFGGGCVLILTGVALIVYYMTFGIYYDDESFILSTFGKTSMTYRFADICYQQLYIASGNIVVELSLKDERTVQLQSTMVDVYPFLDHAFEAWLRQTGRTKEDCPFYAPEKSCWFPTQEAQ